MRELPRPLPNSGAKPLESKWDWIEKRARWWEHMDGDHAIKDDIKYWQQAEKEWEEKYGQ